MKKNLSRPASFAVVTLVYILASASGIGIYLLLGGETWLRLLAADCAATVLVFIFSVIFRNASVYDPYWSVQPIVILWAFAASGSLTVPKILLLAAVTVWGVRLTANWAYTFHGLAHQDWRYTQLREQTGIFYPLVNFFGIHMVPTLVVYGCTMPAVMVMESEAEARPLSYIFFLLSLAAATLQGTADVQMHRFRKGGTGGFINTGLWKYSRHPNYLGEIIMWWSVAFQAVCVLGFNWSLIAGAAANTLLFLCVSIPLADGRQSRKAGFEQYRAGTRMLLPVKKRLA